MSTVDDALGWDSWDVHYAWEEEIDFAAAPVSREAVPENFVRRIGIFGCDEIETRVSCHDAALELFLGKAASKDEHVDVLIMLSDWCV